LSLGTARPGVSPPSPAALSVVPLALSPDPDFSRRPHRLPEQVAREEMPAHPGPGPSSAGGLLKSEAQASVVRRSAVLVAR
jgi:hypothetical protein